MRTQSLAKLIALVAFASAGCEGVLVGGPGDDPPPGEEPPPPDPPVPQPAIYKRGSMAPLYALTPRAEYGRFVHEGVNMADADFVAVGNNFVSASQKMDEIAAQIGAERGTPVSILTDSADRQRANQIPFRGNPSDVDLIEVAGQTKIVVPLGGDLMTPGNEIAIVTGELGTVQRVRVGIRPQRVAVHESGLAFVCNQYSNYISVVDLRTAQLLRNSAGEAVEIATEYNCNDLLLVERNVQAQDEDEVDLYVANSWRASVLKYGLEVVRDALNDRAIDVRVVDPAVREPASAPAAEITGVGTNPQRLSLSESQDAIYVSNGRGGEFARIALSSKAVQRVYLNAPAMDAVQIADQVYVSTTTKDRGLLSDDEIALPPQVQANPVVLAGADGQSHVVHPGALFDETRSYNFEDLRSGVFAINFLLNNTPPIYYTDDISPEINFAAQQKVLRGAQPLSMVRNAAGTRLYAAMSGSDIVQEFEVVGGAFRLRRGQRIFQTQERPFALALDEARGELYVATWGGEQLEVFDIDTGNRLDAIDLGYGTLPYPATNIERGEFLFYNAEWSNNGRKSCATCHTDELLADGIGYANGATAPTSYHQVTPNFNLMTTDSYFWNGSFANGSYTSLALAAQTRTNCELILFGLIEGISSDPDQRVGDPQNRVTNGNDAQCRPDAVQANGLPANFAQIAQVIAQQKLVAEQVIQQVTGIDRDSVFRFVDFYSVSELRVPPNPLKHLKVQNELDQATAAKIEEGKALFSSAGCATCHDPNNTRHPFTDGLNHGAGADYAERFVDIYFADNRIVNEIGGIPQQMLEALRGSTPDREINVHLAPIDFFVPFCFDAERCLQFEDPLVVRGVEPAESDRIDLLVQINLADPDRGFIPGNLPGQPSANTPSLRGTWWKANLLHHGHAYTIAEAILGPGHAALRPGEDGFAVDSLGQVDVHGATSGLSPAQVEALVLYVSNIE